MRELNFQISDRFEKRSFTLVACRLVQASRELAEKQRALAAEHAAEKKALAAKKAEADARAREVEAEARRAREAAEAKAREEADGTYAAGPFLDGTYVKSCVEINQ